jgi:hypothetical protein
VGCGAEEAEFDGDGSAATLVVDGDVGVGPAVSGGAHADMAVRSAAHVQARTIALAATIMWMDPSEA